MRWAGSWVEGCGAIGVAVGTAAGLGSWAATIPIGLASKHKPASAAAPMLNIVILVNCVFMISSGNTNAL